MLGKPNTSKLTLHLLPLNTCPRHSRCRCCCRKLLSTCQHHTACNSCIHYTQRPGQLDSVLPPRPKHLNNSLPTQTQVRHPNQRWGQPLPLRKLNPALDHLDHSYAIYCWQHSSRYIVCLLSGRRQVCHCCKYVQRPRRLDWQVVLNTSS
jgi:hypothetical protein